MKVYSKKLYKVYFDHVDKNVENIYVREYNYNESHPIVCKSMEGAIEFIKIRIAECKGVKAPNGLPYDEVRNLTSNKNDDYATTLEDGRLLLQLKTKSVGNEWGKSYNQAFGCSVVPIRPFVIEC